MGCEWLKTADGIVMHINRDHSRGPKRHCKFCHKDYHGGKLCDFPVGDGKTCDAEMCDSCARTLGRQDTNIGNGLKRLGDSIDVCPIHRGHAFTQSGELKVTEPEAQQQSLFGPPPPTQGPGPVDPPRPPRDRWVR